jgi:Bacterial Ig-like domain (group 1)
VRIVPISGYNQTAPPNTPLPAPLVVKVLDANGFGVSGVTVNFRDNGAGGTFVANSVITGSMGKATAQYTTGPNTGTVTITASTAGLNSLNFKVTVQ